MKRIKMVLYGEPGVGKSVFATAASDRFPLYFSYTSLKLCILPLLPAFTLAKSADGQFLQKLKRLHHMQPQQSILKIQ